MKTIHTLLLGGALLAAACSDDCDLTHIDSDLARYPQLVAGSFPSGDIRLAIGQTLTLAPETLNPEGVVYSWQLNGSEPVEGDTFTYTPEGPFRGELSCTAANDYGRATWRGTIRTTHDFAKGFFFAAGECLHFRDTDAAKSYTDVVASLNFGKTLLNDPSYNRLSFARMGGRLLAYTKTSTSNEDHLFVLDAATLYLEDSGLELTNLMNVSPLNDLFAVAINSEGIYRFEPTGLYPTKVAEGGYISNTVLAGGKLLANATYRDEAKVRVYDVAALLAADADHLAPYTELELVQNQKANFVQGSDGAWYTLGVADGASVLARIDAELNVTTAAALPFTPARAQYWGDHTIGIAAVGGSIFIASQEGAVYRYTGDDASLAAPFVAAPEDEESLSGLVGLSDGSLAVCYATEVGYNTYEGRIVLYDAAGTIRTTIACDGMPYDLFTL